MHAEIDFEPYLKSVILYLCVVLTQLAQITPFIYLAYHCNYFSHSLFGSFLPLSDLCHVPSATARRFFDSILT